VGCTKFDKKSHPQNEVVGSGGGQFCRKVSEDVPVMNRYKSIKWRSVLCAFSSVTLLIVATNLRSGAQAANQASKSATSRAKPPLIPILGPEQAAATIIVFSDFECFQCGRSAAVLIDILQSTSDVKLIFKNAPAASNKDAMLAHEAALAAGAQGKFWEMHNLLFANQERLARADLIGYAKQLGLNINEFREALDDHRYRPQVEQDLAEAKGLGVTITPTFFVNGRRLIGPQGEAALQAVVESVLTNAPKQPPPEIVASSGPAQAISLRGAPAEGPATAPVSLVEFADFECPFCAKSASALHDLLKAYPTQVRLSFKNYPLPFHAESALAHEAALAAREQGKFWEMYDLLYSGQDKLSREDLLKKAQLLHLDMPRFTADLDSHRFKAAVDADRQEGDRLGVDGTPFFFINGHAVSGAIELSEFKKMIDAALSETAASPKH
jgi:protein-disulfide isomerase